MKTNLKPTVPTLAPHARPEGVPRPLTPVPSIEAIIPVAADKPAFVDEVAAAPQQDFNLVRDLSLFARVLRRAQGGRHVLAIFVTSIVVTIANMLAAQ